jgi:hypothetical protein
MACQGTITPRTATTARQQARRSAPASVTTARQSSAVLPRNFRATHETAEFPRFFARAGNRPHALAIQGASA